MTQEVHAPHVRERRLVLTSIDEIPSVEELLHARVQDEETPHQQFDGLHELRTRVPALKVQKTGDRPVGAVVPRGFGRHHLRVAHERILAAVETEKRFEQPKVVRVERLGPFADVFAAGIAHDQIGSAVVADRNEVGSRRVEGIGEDTSLADERPSVGREHPLAGVSVMSQGQEILEAILVTLHDPGALRLELAQPVERALEPIQPREGMQIAVCHDADARAPRSKRDEPHPVAAAHQVVRTEPALTARDSPAPLGIVTPIVDLDALGDSEPTRVRAVVGRSCQTKLAANRACAAGGVHDPSRTHLSRPPVTGFDPDRVVQRVQSEVSYRAVVQHFDAGLPQLGEQVVLEPAAVELERGYRRKRRGAQLDAPSQIAIVALREEVPQPELLQLTFP